MDVDEADTSNYQKANEPFLTAGTAMRVLPFTQTSTFSLITQRVINEEQNGCLLGRSFLEAATPEVKQSSVPVANLA